VGGPAGSKEAAREAQARQGAAVIEAVYRSNPA